MGNQPSLQFQNGIRKRSIASKEIYVLQGVPKILLYSCHIQYIEVLLFSLFFFSGCLTRRVINAARIVLFKSTIRLNNFSSDKKHNFIIDRLIFNDQ